MSVVVGVLATSLLTFILVVTSKKLCFNKDTKAIDSEGSAIYMIFDGRVCSDIFSLSDPQTSRNPAYEIVTYS